MTRKRWIGSFLLLLGAALTLGLAKKPSPRLDAVQAVYENPSPQSFSVVYALSDVHGMSAEAVHALTENHIVDTHGHWAAGNALLIVVGDSIDKGPDSIGTVDLWRRLSPEAAAAGGNVLHLLGNHEVELLANPSHPRQVLAQELKAKHLTVNDLVGANTPRGEFLRAEPLAAKIGNWVFCHAGLYPDMTWSAFKAKAASILSSGSYGDSFILGHDSILEAKNWWKKAAQRQQLVERLHRYGFDGMVQGHQPGAYNIDDRIGSIEDGHFVKVDCGVSPPAGSHPLEILEFPHPAQLGTNQTPDMVVLHDDGSSEKLVPTQLHGDVEPVDPAD